MISPANSIQTEYVPFSVTFTVSDVIPPVIQSVSIASSDGKDHSSDLTITISSPTTVEVGGVLSDIFNRELYFVAGDGTHKVVSRYADIPSDFQTLYQYIAPTVNSVILTLTMTTTTLTEVATITINNNFAVANAKLAEYIAKGQY